MTISTSIKMAAAGLLTAILFILTSIPVSAHEGSHEAAEEAAEQTPGFPGWIHRISLTGTIDADISWSDGEEPGVDEAGDSSEISVSTVELGAGIDFTDWFAAEILLLSEDLGTDDATDVNVDEAYITISPEKLPLYVVAGKRAQPFGVYENHLLQDPMTQDAYETNRPGLTVGYTGPMELNVTATLYGSEEMMTHLFESELFDTDAVARVSESSGNDVSSYIISAGIDPIDDKLHLYAAYISEDGLGRRNETINLAAVAVVDSLRFDVEYMKALGREIYSGFDRPFKESVISLTAAYEFVLREREVLGGALFEERRAHLVAEPIEVALRFEHFDDDGMAEVSGTWSVEDRYGGGVRYSFYSNQKTGVVAYTGIEYRHTDYRVHTVMAEELADGRDELFARVGITF